MRFTIFPNLWKNAAIFPNSTGTSSRLQKVKKITVKQLGQVKKVKKISDFKKTVDIKINGADVRAGPDSRVDVNLMDEHQFKALTDQRGSLF